MEERLDALKKTVRNWDWRASSPSVDPEGSIAPSASSLPTPVVPTANVVEIPDTVVAQDPAPVADFPATQHVPERRPRHAKVEPAPADALECQPEDANSWTSRPRPPLQAPPQPSSDAASWFPQPAAPPLSAKPQARATRPTARPRVLSRIKVFALYLASAAVVLLVIGAIRFFA